MCEVARREARKVALVQVRPRRGAAKTVHNVFLWERCLLVYSLCEVARRKARKVVLVQAQPRRGAARVERNVF